MTPVNDERYLAKLEDGTLIGPLAAVERLDRDRHHRPGFVLLGGGHSIFHSELQMVEPTQWLMNGAHIAEPEYPHRSLTIEAVAKLTEDHGTHLLDWKAL